MRIIPWTGRQGHQNRPPEVLPVTEGLTRWLKFLQNIKLSIFNKSSNIIADLIVTGSETGYRKLKRLFILEFNLFIIKNFLAIANINTIIAFEFTRPIQCPPQTLHTSKYFTPNFS